MAYGMGSSSSRRQEREQYQRYCTWVDKINVAVSKDNEAHPNDPRKTITALSMGAWLAKRYDRALSGLASALGVNTNY